MTVGVSKSFHSLTEVIDAYHSHVQGEPPIFFSQELVDKLKSTNKKPIYLIDGKPASGKTTQSQKFAKVTGLDLVSFDSLLNTILNETNVATQGTIAAEIRQQVSRGLEITAEQFYRLLEERLNAPSILSRGVIIDGSLFTSPNTATCTLNIVKQLLERTMKTHIVIHVYLKMADEDVVRRRSGQFMDPLTGVVYSGDQVQLSWTLGPINLEMGGDGQGGEKDPEEDQIPADVDTDEAIISFVNTMDWEINPADKVAILEGRFPAQRAMDPDGEPENLEDYPETDQDKRLRLYREYKNRETHYLGKVTLKKVPREVLYRLVKRPEDTPDLIQQALVEYQLIQSELSTLLSNLLNVVILTLEATQLPEAIFYHFYAWYKLNFGRVHTNLVFPQKLPVPDSRIASNSAQIVKFLTTAELHNSVARRQLGPWKLKCPVSYYNSKIFLDGKPSYSASYKNDVFLFASDDYLETFMNNPDQYVNQEITKWPVKLLLIGDVSTLGIVSDALSKKYDIPVLNLETSIRQFAADVVPEDPAWAGFHQRLNLSIKNGGLNGDNMMEFVQYWLSKQPEDGKQGWILQNCPSTTEQCQRFVSFSRLPDRVMIFDNAVSFEDGKIKPSGEYPDIVNVFELANCPTFVLKPNMENLVSESIRLSNPFLSVAAAHSEVNDETINDFGWCKNYDPVILKHHNVLLQGKNSLSVLFNEKIFVFSSEENKIAFLTNPNEYCLQSKHTIPPLRIMLTGTMHSGKEELITEITKWTSNTIPVLFFDSYFAKYVENLPTDIQTQVSTALNQGEEISKDIIVDCLQSLYQAEPFKSNGFILVDFPKTKYEAAALVGKPELSVDAAIFMKLEPEDIMNRAQKVAKSFDKPMDDVQQSSLQQQAEQQLNQIFEAHKLLQNETSLYIVEVEAGKFPKQVSLFVKNALQKLTIYRNSLLFDAHPLKQEEAEEYIKYGSRMLSSFGRFCPVELSHHRLLTKQCLGSIPVSVGGFIFYLKNEENLRAFINAPNTYLNRGVSNTVLHPKICVLGSPKSGSTTVAKRIALDFDLEYISLAKAVNFVIDNCPKSETAQKILTELKSGRTLPDELAVTALEMLISRALCSFKGWVLDGYPQTPEQAAHMTSRYIVPSKIFELSVDLSVALDRAHLEQKVNTEQENPVFRMDCTVAVVDRYDVHTKNIGFVRDYYTQIYGPKWTNVQSTCSKWALERILCGFVYDYTFKYQVYKDSVIKGTPAPCFDTGLSVEQENKWLSEKFKSYCPVTYVDNDQLVFVDHNQYAVQYKGVQYRTCGYDQMIKLLTNPSRYAFHEGLPKELPSRVSLEKASCLVPKGVEFGAYCLVSYIKSAKALDGLVEGFAEYVVQYDSKFYCFSCEDSLSEFMLSPWKYTKQPLPSKLPPRKSDVNLAQMPMVGYMELTVYSILNKALISVGNEKPKHPFRTLPESAIEYIALYLKAHNPRMAPHVKNEFMQKMKDFRYRCGLLKYLSTHMGKEFQQSEDREPDFDLKMSEFLSFNKAVGRNQM